MDWYSVFDYAARYIPDRHYLALWFGFTPFLPKIALDDRIPIVSVFIIPYIWSYAYWAMGPMAVSKCEKGHFADYMAASLISYLAGVIVLAFFPTYMDRVAKGLFEVPVNPTVFDRLRMFWYSLDGSEMAYNLLPSFHCINSTLCYLGVAGRKEIPVWFRAYSLVTTFLIYAFTVYVKQHYFLDIITGVALALAVYFICKKFHWGRMFRPAVRLYAAWKAKNTVKKAERDRVDIIILMTEILSGISFYVLPAEQCYRKAGRVCYNQQ